MYKLDLIQVDTFIEKIKNNTNKLSSTGESARNLLYLNAILSDTKCLIKHYRNKLEI